MGTMPPHLHSHQQQAQIYHAQNNQSQNNNSENTQTPSIISTNSTISTQSVDQSRVVHPYSVDLNVQSQIQRDRFRIPSLPHLNCQTHTTMNHSPNTMNCRDNLHHSPTMFDQSQIVINSPIIHMQLTTNQEEDMEETKQILLTQQQQATMDNNNHGQSGKNFSNGNNLKNLSDKVDDAVEDE